MLKIYDLIRISFRQVYRQKKRSLGVVLSLALGTAGLIAVITMGDEVKANLNRDLDLLGGVTIVKVFYENYKHTDTPPQWFRDGTVEKLRKLPGVDVASLTTNNVNWKPVTIGRREMRFAKQGVDAHYWKANGLEAGQGRLISSHDVQKRALVCVLGKDLATDLFGKADPIGQLIRIDNDVYRVVGTVTGLQLGPRSEYFFVPLTTAMDRFGRNMEPDRLYVRTSGWDAVPVIAEGVGDFVAALQPSQHLQVEVSWEHLNRVKRIVWWVELFIYLSITATLVLGGFGIWNGMMSSVTARTREIGLKKSMGAEDEDILAQFLMEAIWLSLSAALLGVTLGRIGVEVVSHFLGSHPSEDLFLFYTGVSLVFSCVLGVLAGFYPAMRASRMDVVTAIRYE